MGTKTSRRLDEDLQTVNNAATVRIKTLRSRWHVLRYNFPLWPSDEKAMLGVHNVKPFLKRYRDCGGNNVKHARSSRKRASRSCTSVRKFSSSTVSAVDHVVANSVRNITICKNTPMLANSALHLGHSLGGQDLDEALLDVKY